MGGTDSIVAGQGNNLIVGGYGSATITAGDGLNIVIGGNGEADFAGVGWLDLIESVAPVPTTASNTITRRRGRQHRHRRDRCRHHHHGDGTNLVFGDDGWSASPTSTATPSRASATTSSTTSSADRTVQLPGPWGRPTPSASAAATSSSSPAPATIPSPPTASCPPRPIRAGASGHRRQRLRHPRRHRIGDLQRRRLGGVRNPDLPQHHRHRHHHHRDNEPVVLTGAADKLISPTATPSMQTASAAAPAGQDTSPNLTNAELRPIVVEAEAIWAKLLGPDSARLAILNGITVQVGDLAGNASAHRGRHHLYRQQRRRLGLVHRLVRRGGDAEFGATATPGLLSASTGSAAAGHMDLLSTLLHEMGNVMGLPRGLRPGCLRRYPGPGRSHPAGARRSAGFGVRCAGDRLGRRQRRRRCLHRSGFGTPSPGSMASSTMSARPARPARTQPSASSWEDDWQRYHPLRDRPIRPSARRNDDTLTAVRQSLHRPG